MNRRRFLQSAAALFALPAGAKLSLGAPAMPVAAPAVVPQQARFWAIYMSGLHGECTPQALQSLLQIPASDAQRYLGQLVAEGVLKPNPLMKQTASKLLNGDDDGLWGRLKQRLDRKTEVLSDTTTDLGANHVSNDHTVISDNQEAALEDELQSPHEEAAYESSNDLLDMSDPSAELETIDDDRLTEQRIFEQPT